MRRQSWLRSLTATLRGLCKESNRIRRIIMGTLSKLMIAAGVLGTMAGTGATAALAQGVYLQGPGFGVDIGRPAYRERHYYRGYSDYASPRFYSEPRSPDVRASLVSLA